MELWNGTSAVNALEWHPAVPGLLAGGFNRIKREESSVLVWDVDRPEWSWLKTSEDSDLWPNPIVKSRSRGSMERLSTFAASGTIGSGSGDRLDVASGVMTGSVTHSSSGLSAGSRGSDGDRSGSDRVSGGRASSGESIDTLSASGGPLNALRRDISGSFTTSSQSSASERFTAPFGDGASVTVAMGEQEQSQSLGWLPDSPACLAVGTSLQWLRIYDIRTQKAVAKVVAHPGTPVRGVRVAPTSPHHIATFEKPDSIGGASIVKIWDHRLLQAPLLQWAVGAPLIDVAWVPTAQHDGNLATLVTGGQPSDAGAILLWSTLGATDMVQAQRGADEDSDHGIKRRNAPPAPIIPTPARIIRITGQNSPAAFAWHPKLPQSLVLAEDGQIAMMTLRPPTAVAWHGESIAVGFGAKLRSVQVAMPDSLETTMKRRVEAGYAMSARQNAEITAASGASGEHTKAARSSFDQYGVHFAWEWIEHMERLSEYNMLGKRLDAGKRGDKNDHPYHGVRQAIPKGATGAELSSEAYTLAVNGLEGIVYGGHARQRAMRLCGWEGIAGQVDFASCGLDAQAQEAQLLRLEGEGHHTRAAALAIFALDIRRAVLSLQRAVSASANASGLDRLGSDEARGEANRWLRLAALALGGYSPGRETEWGQTCVDLGILAAPRRSGTPQRLHYAQEEQDAMQGAVADPYLRAAFVFLACHATHMSSLEGASKTGTGAKTEASITPSDASSNVTEESYLNQPGSPGNVSVDSSVHRSVYSAVSQSNSVSTDGERNGSSATVGPDKGSGAGELRFLYKRSHFAPVLEVDGLTRYDTIAFACRFLEDESLASYLDSMESIVIDRGSLEGLLLLGLTEKSIPLLQAYVDATADIQTAALLLAFVSPRRFKCAEATNWMTSYRDLLDRWQLYHQRCQLDICIVPYSGVREVPPQTYATCQVSPSHTILHYMAQLIVLFRIVG